MFRAQAEALSRLYERPNIRANLIQSQLEAAYEKGRRDMARELRDLLGAAEQR